ncbi:MAG TPA: replication initiator [Micromonosporaceae bacterium]|jgi:hypothetical protein
MSADSETASYTSATALSDNDRQPCPVRRRLHDTRSADDRFGRMRSPITNSGGVEPVNCKAKVHKRRTLGLGGRRVLISRDWSGKTLADHKANNRA